MKTILLLVAGIWLLTNNAVADYLHCYCKALDLSPTYDPYGGIASSSHVITFYGDLGGFSTPTDCKTACNNKVLGDSNLCSLNGGASGVKGADMAWDYASFYSLHGPSTPAYLWGTLNAPLNDSYLSPQHGYYNQGVLTCGSGVDHSVAIGDLGDVGSTSTGTSTSTTVSNTTVTNSTEVVVPLGTTTGTITGTSITTIVDTGLVVTVLPSIPIPCKNPLEDDGSHLGAPNHCTFIEAHHRCSSGIASEQASPVARTVHVGTAAANFESVINKKLACCMNTSNTGDLITKFDCMDNSIPKTTDFNALWKSSDSLSAGGQINAVLLSDGSNKPMTGFFTLDGIRCNEFSEFAAPGSGIQGTKINPTLKAGQQNLVIEPSGIHLVSGYLLPVSPGSITLGTQLHKVFPVKIEDMRRCPVLVRAAIVATCPQNSNTTLMAKSYPLTGIPTRCSAAKTVQAHVRIEQIFEIAGQAKLPTLDTMIDMSAQSISLKKILSQKNGNQCEPGSHSVGTLCVYNP